MHFDPSEILCELKGRPPCFGNYDTKLFSASLTSLCEENRLGLLEAKSRLPKYVVCNEYGISHWHPRITNDNENAQRGTATPSMEVSNRTEPQRHKPFTQQMQDATNVFDDLSQARESTCYLCTTQCNSRDHLKVHRPITAKPPHARFQCQYSLPYVKPKPHDSDAEDLEPIKSVSYRVDLKIGLAAGSGSQADLYLTIHGSENNTRPQQLTKNNGSLPFRFLRGATEIFYFRNCEVGKLRYIELENTTEDKELLIDSLTLTNLVTKEAWLFDCNFWLSSKQSDAKLKRKVKGQQLQTVQKAFKVITHTGTQSLAGTTAKGYVILRGSKRSSRKMLLKPSDNRRAFSRGERDEFMVVVDDIGKLTGLRIEIEAKEPKIHARDEREELPRNKSAKERTEKQTRVNENAISTLWYLERLVLKDLSVPTKYEFSIEEWLGVDSESGCCFKELKLAEAVNVGAKISSGDDVKGDTNYDISILTGKKTMAGTDATVYVQIFGQKLRTKPYKFEDKKKDKFEKGQVDTFCVKGPNVGQIKRIKVWHDNKGFGAGWHLEQITVKRYLSKLEIHSLLKGMIVSRKLPKGLKAVGDLISVDSNEKSKSKQSDSEDEEEKREKEGEEAEDDVVVSDSRRARKMSRGKYVPEERKNKNTKINSGSGGSESSDNEEVTRDYFKRRSSKTSSKTKNDKEDLTYGSQSRSSVITLAGRNEEERLKMKQRVLTKQASHISQTDEPVCPSLQVVVPNSEEVVFKCDIWLAKDEGDKKIDRFFDASNHKIITSPLSVRDPTLIPKTRKRDNQEV